MSWAHELDFDVSLFKETKHPNQDKWCLREHKDDGAQNGPDLIPSDTFVEFQATAIQISRLITAGDESSDEPIIFATLEAGGYRGVQWIAPSISMLGTKRYIKEVNVTVRKVEDPSEEGAYASGTVAFEGIVNNEHPSWSDSLSFDVRLGSEKFDSIFNLIQKNEVDSLTLTVRKVEGFYEEEYRFGHLDAIKVLASADDQGLELDEVWRTIVPKLGKVGEFWVRVERNLSPRMPKRSDNQSNDYVDKDSDVVVQSPSSQGVGDESDQRHNFYERALSRISKLLVILIVIELVRAFSG